VLPEEDNGAESEGASKWPNILRKLSGLC